jgi:hypothetical protein
MFHIFIDNGANFFLFFFFALTYDKFGIFMRRKIIDLLTMSIFCERLHHMPQHIKEMTIRSLITIYLLLSPRVYLSNERNFTHFIRIYEHVNVNERSIQFVIKCSFERDKLAKYLFGKLKADRERDRMLRIYKT